MRTTESIKSQSNEIQYKFFDRCDYIPILSTFTNLGGLILATCSWVFKQAPSSHLNTLSKRIEKVSLRAYKKSHVDKFLLLVPVFGNIGVALLNQSRKTKNDNSKEKQIYLITEEDELEANLGHKSSSFPLKEKKVIKRPMMKASLKSKEKKSIPKKESLAKTVKLSPRKNKKSS